MRAAMPFILIFLALFTAACIAFVAWELTSEKPDRDGTRSDDIDQA